MKYFLSAVLISFTMLLTAQAPNPQKGTGQTGKGQQGQSGQTTGQQAQGTTTSKTIESYPKWKWRRKFKMAKKKYKQGEYYIAAAYLEDVYKDKPDKIDVTHLLGECNRYLKDYEAAEKYYKAGVTKDPIAYVNDQFYLGQMQKCNGHYEDAKKTFQDYMKVKLDKGDLNLKERAKVEIEGCDSALVWIKNPSKVKVERTLGAVNTPIQDLSPKPLKNDRLIFASQKSDTAVDFTKSKADFFTSIFTAKKSGKVYTDRTMLPSPPNDNTMNTGNAILSGDEKTMIYTKCADTVNVDNIVRCKLYRTTKKNDMEWNEPEELKSLNSAEGTTTQPAFGVDADGNDILYFVSDRKGSKGGLDIFYAKMNSDKTFGPVVNAGPEINSTGNEVSPFYDNKSKTLYFSSDGHPSMGGLDIFKISGVPGKWAKEPINLGVPINSQANDFYYALDEKGEKGFLVSNRVGTTSSRGATCCDDIWSVIVVHDVFLKATYVKRGDASKTPVQGVDASMYKVVGNNFEFVANAKTTNVPFVFPLKRATSYKINGNKDGYWPSIDNLSVSEEEERDTIEQTFYLDPIIKIHIKIPNVYFAFDKSNVIDFYKHQIDSVVRVLNEHPGYSVEIQGHTDTMGSDEYNEKLSMRRANEVKQFLIKKDGIAENRIVAKWFGRKVPAVPNLLPNGEDDPEGRARNRRVEFKIITDKPEDAPEIENVVDVVKAVKTGPGFTYGVKKPAPKKK